MSFEFSRSSSSDRPFLTFYFFVMLERKDRVLTFPKQVKETHPGIADALTRNTSMLLELLEWIDDHPAFLASDIPMSPKNTVVRELSQLVNNFGSGGAEIIQQLYRSMYYTSMYLVEYATDSQEAQSTLWALNNLIDFFGNLYKKNVI